MIHSSKVWKHCFIFNTILSFLLIFFNSFFIILVLLHSFDSKLLNLTHATYLLTILLNNVRFRFKFAASLLVHKVKLNILNKVWLWLTKKSCSFVFNHVVGQLTDWHEPKLKYNRWVAMTRGLRIMGSRQ